MWNKISINNYFDKFNEKEYLENDIVFKSTKGLLNFNKSKNYKFHHLKKKSIFQKQEIQNKITYENGILNKKINTIKYKSGNLNPKNIKKLTDFKLKPSKDLFINKKKQNIIKSVNLNLCNRIKTTTSFYKRSNLIKNYERKNYIKNNLVFSFKVKNKNFIKSERLRGTQKNFLKNIKLKLNKY